jgi:hypothetical protein
MAAIISRRAGDLSRKNSCTSPIGRSFFGR